MYTHHKGEYNCLVKYNKKSLKFADLSADINECLEGKHGCQDNSDCVNTEGSYNCECREGFFKDGANCVGKSAKLPHPQGEPLDKDSDKSDYYLILSETELCIRKPSVSSVKIDTNVNDFL